MAARFPLPPPGRPGRAGIRRMDRVLLPRPACQRRWQCRARPSPQKNPETYHWATDLLGIPVIDHWWQTESGWPIDANPTGNELLPLQAGSRTRPLPVWDVRILTPGGTPAPAGQDGSIVVKLPMRPTHCSHCGMTTHDSCGRLPRAVVRGTGPAGPRAGRRRHRDAGGRRRRQAAQNSFRQALAQDNGQHRRREEPGGSLHHR